MAYSSLRKVQKTAGGMNFSSAILYNRWLLYFIFIVAFGDLLLLFNQKDITAGVVFIIVGLLTSFFSKNMIVILCVSMAVSHIFKAGIQNLEGLVSSAPSKTPTMDLDMDDKEDKESMGGKDDEDSDSSSKKEDDEMTEDKSKSSSKKSSKKSSDKLSSPEDIMKAISKTISTPTASIPTPSSSK